MASADLSFTKDGLIYRPQHIDEDDEDDFLTGHSQKDGGTVNTLNKVGGVSRVSSSGICRPSRLHSTPEMDMHVTW